MDPLKADILRTGRVFQQRASFSSTAALEGRGWRLGSRAGGAWLAISLRQTLPQPHGNLAETFTLVLRLLSFPVALLCSTLISLLNMSAGEPGSGQLLFSELFQFPPLSLSYSRSAVGEESH